MRKNEKLQELCRTYLAKLKRKARKHGLAKFVNDTIIANKRKECKATKDEVEMLARMCDDDRISQKDIPPILGKSYRQCFEEDDFSHIDRISNRSSYSKISTMLYACGAKNKKKNG